MLSFRKYNISSILDNCFVIDYNIFNNNTTMIMQTWGCVYIWFGNVDLRKFWRLKIIWACHFHLWLIFMCLSTISLLRLRSVWFAYALTKTCSMVNIHPHCRLYGFAQTWLWCVYICINHHPTIIHTSSLPLNSSIHSWIQIQSFLDQPWH